MGDADDVIDRPLDQGPRETRRQSGEGKRLDDAFEGAKDPISRFEATFDGLSDDAKDRFYRRNFEDMFVAG